MIIENVSQNTPEWLALKAGVPSASNFDKIVTTKGVRSKTAEKYLNQLAGERITGIREEGYQNASMLRGIEMEEHAVSTYEVIRGIDTEKVGVCYKDEKKSFLCSPDRVIKDDSGDSIGLLEIKCPEIHTHVGYLLQNKFPTTYFQQVQGQLFVTGLSWCDFMSYYPGLKPMILRIEKDEAFQDALGLELKIFCAELEKIVKLIK